MNNYVGFWKRLIAYLIDTFLIGSAFIVLASTLFENGLLSSSNLLNLFSFLFVGLYLILFWGFQDGQTLGARLLKFKVVNEDRTKLSLGGAILRYFGFIISCVTIFLGFIWVAFDKRKQGLHDKIAKTLVVSTGSPNVLFVLITFIGLGIVYSIFMGSFAINSYRSLQNNNKIGLTTLTDNQINSMSIIAFAKANEQRKAKNVTELKIDNRLCAYAQRRIEQMDKLGKLDDGRGFYEDTANIEMKNAYFTENPITGELSRKMTAVDFEEDGISAIIDSWTKVENSNLINPVYENGCIRTNRNFMVFILGGTGR